MTMQVEVMENNLYNQWGTYDFSVTFKLLVGTLKTLCIINEQGTEKQQN